MTLCRKARSKVRKLGSSSRGTGVGGRTGPGSAGARRVMGHLDGPSELVPSYLLRSGLGSIERALFPLRAGAVAAASDGPRPPIPAANDGECAALQLRKVRLKRAFVYRLRPPYHHRAALCFGMAGFTRKTTRS